MNRRGLLAGLGGLGLAAAGAVGTYAVTGTRARQAEAEVGELRRTVQALEAEAVPLRERVGRLSQRWAFSGGGTNRKMMPDANGQPTVELLEVFSFDRNHAFCRVDTNPAPFVMPTYGMGKVPIPANGFFMTMTAGTADEADARQTPEGKATVTVRGRLACHTEVVTASTKLGSRTVAEPASYEIVAVDGGVGGAAAGDSFAFKVFFDEKSAPVNHAIFGPEFTFTGQMVSGEITIQNLARLVPF